MTMRMQLGQPVLLVTKACEENKHTQMLPLTAKVQWDRNPLQITLKALKVLPLFIPTLQGLPLATVRMQYNAG